MGCTLITCHSVLCPQEWLSRFGYLPPADPATGQLQTQEELSKAIIAMQQFGGLETTGILGQFSQRHQEAPWFRQGCFSLAIPTLAAQGPTISH